MNREKAITAEAQRNAETTQELKLGQVERLWWDFIRRVFPSRLRDAVPEVLDIDR